MSWQKFSDRARESKKVRKASDAALVLWWAAGNYCCEHRTDGFVAKGEIEDVWRPIGRRFDHQKHAAECVAIGLLIDHGDHYEVHDFLEFNKSREDDEKRKKSDAKRAAAYRARQKAAKKLGIVTRDETHDGMCDESSDAVVTHDARHGADTRGASDVRHAPLVPSRPVPLRSEEEERERASAPPATAPKVEPIPFEPAPWTAERAALVFRAQFFERYRTEPSMGGRHIAGFAERVASTAQARQRPPEDLYREVLATWLMKPRNDAERRSPYACFVQAWGELTMAGGAVRDVRRGYVPSAPAEAYEGRELSPEEIFGIQPPEDTRV